MKKTTSAVAALLLTTTAASAAGIERGNNDYSVLFEDGNYAKLSYSTVRPSVSGDYGAVFGPFAGTSTGTMSEDYSSIGASLKYGITPDLDIALFLNQPFGANALYPDGPYSGLGAQWDSNQVALVLKYQATPNISVYGGVRSIESNATIAIPDTLVRGGLARGAQAAVAAATASGNPTAIAQANGALAGVVGAPAGAFAYDAKARADRQTSYIAGAAYEMPEIALRVALTYESGYTHSFDTTETVLASPATSGDSTTEIEMPQSVTLDFQSGVAANTLVFGSIKWSEWSVWEVRPAGYEALTRGQRVTGIDNDTFTYRLGVGRQFTDELSGFARVTYEASNGDPASRLAPTDGSTAIGIGGTYSFDDIEVTAGVEYVMLGDATDDSGTEFADNSAIGVGISIGYSF
ncbi:outer membrane protein transport protein [Yoonia sp. 208BN28-4]|uniref:outer membrane protein transport protein n=1 Tax=Yoonia sp. 208BN28-4 TaxID=3126505 RepID=UPI0030B448C0